MKKYFFMMIYATTLFGMNEQSTPHVIHISVKSLKNNILVYCSKKFVDEMKGLNIRCRYDEPFVPCNKANAMVRTHFFSTGSTADNNEIGRIQFLPLNVFKRGDGTYKEKGEKLITLKDHMGQSKIKFIMDSVDDTWDKLLMRFEFAPQYHPLKEELLGELIGNGILEHSGKLIKNGPRGFFKEKYAQEKAKQAGQATKDLVDKYENLLKGLATKESVLQERERKVEQRENKVKEKEQALQKQIENKKDDLMLEESEKLVRARPTDQGSEFVKKSVWESQYKRLNWAFFMLVSSIISLRLGMSFGELSLGYY